MHNNNPAISEFVAAIHTAVNNAGLAKDSRRLFNLADKAAAIAVMRKHNLSQYSCVAAVVAAGLGSHSTWTNSIRYWGRLYDTGALNSPETMASVRRVRRRLLDQPDQLSDTILTMRKQGMGWDELEQKLVSAVAEARKGDVVGRVQDFLKSSGLSASDLKAALTL